MICFILPYLVYLLVNAMNEITLRS
jgi:hypothetical protein